MDPSAPVTPPIVPPQPQIQPQPQMAYTTPAVPGKTLGLVGFILAIVVPLVGLILSIIALVKSKKVQAKNGLALAGVIVGAVLTVIDGLVITLVVLIAYNGIQIATQASQLCSEQGNTGTVMVGTASFNCDSLHAQESAASAQDTQDND